MTYFAVAVAALLLPAQPAGGQETVLVYRLRGEIRPLLFWIGREDVGGGHIRIHRQEHEAGARWSEDIEVLFGSDPERIPRRVNRWGYGREISEWVQEGGRPRLLGTVFEGIMRHSGEAAISEVRHDTGLRYTYDATRSTVLPRQARHEFHILSDDREFDYRNPGLLLPRYLETLNTGTPARTREIVNSSSLYGAPYGFLSGVAELVRQIAALRDASPGVLQRARPKLMFVFNSKPYLLEVSNVNRTAERLARAPARPFRDVVLIEFRCFNAVKRTTTRFSLWVPLSGDTAGLPVRIRLEPRWWLRLQLDLDVPATRIASGGAQRACAAGSRVK